ncbi:NAD(P)/FAD-dependent oxidoreductase [Elstera litoralis]|nr:FAD-dependent oxidoreductase [Elstera litoralis]
MRNARPRVAIIGAGMAGASLAYELADAAEVLLLERESHPGYHTTGRSAAMFTETYGPAPVRALTRASRDFYENPPENFISVPILTPRGVILVADASQEALIAETLAAGATHRLTPAEAEAQAPILRGDRLIGAVAEPGARAIDVDALLQAYLRGVKARGGRLLCEAEVTALDRDGAGWRVTTPAGVFPVDTIVNASGAWGDKIAELAGVSKLGLVPKRRTAILIDAPSDPQAWPMLIDMAEAWYIKPDAGLLLASPADATPVEPQDAQPDEMDIAICVDRIETATKLQVKHIRHKWAGLRSFVGDGVPVAGFDKTVPGFFWLIGQGGYGIQTASALARLSAALILGAPIPADLKAEGVIPAELAPTRLR